MNRIKHFLRLHKWLPIKNHNGNYICRDCLRMSYIGPYGDGLEDYPVSQDEYNKYRANV